MITTPRFDLTTYMMLRIRAGYCNYRHMERGLQDCFANGERKLWVQGQATVTYV